MEWSKANIKPDKSRNDVYFSDSNPSFHKKAGHSDVVFDDDLEKAVYDLALLAACNHTVISRGTYSMWAAMMAGGEYYTEYGTIVPPHLQG